MLKPVLEDMSIAEAIEKKRLFIIDYEILKDLPLKNDRKVCAPIGLFFVNKDKILLPVAIQLFQDPGEKNPIFLPTDQEYVWLMAKMWFNNADGQYHQSCTHLGHTHIVIESVAVATHRSLSQSHPIFRLLAPHFLYLIAINKKALGELLLPVGWVDTDMSCGRSGLFGIMRRSFSWWSLDRDGDLLRDLEERGVADPEVLPNYHYRDDALLTRKAINDYVRAIVEQHYYSDERLTEDHEIQEWGHTLASKDGCQLKGIPNDGNFQTADELIKTLTNIIFICSVAHAAANFSQYDEYAFPAYCPLLLRTQPPTDKTSLSEADILAAIPGKHATLDVMVVTKVLSNRGTNSLGDFEIQYIHDPAGVKAVEKFRSDLQKIGAIIDKRNASREHKYPYLHPNEIPNAISI